MKRDTVQRSIILETIKNITAHPTADDVYKAVLKENPTIGRATVYRNLNKLCEEGLIKRRVIPNDADHFDTNCSNHYHAKCMKCGRIFDVDMDYIPEIEKYLKNASDFEIIEYNIIFKGYCRYCKER